MEGLIPPVIIEILANIKEFTAKKNEVLHGMDELNAKGKTTSEKFSALGNRVANYTLVAGAAVAAYSLKLAFDYSKALDTVMLQTKLTEQQVKALSPQILDVSRATATSATDIALAYTQVIKAGVPLNKVQNDVAISAQFAKAQEASLSDTLKAALNIQKLHISGTKSVTETMDIFTNAVQNSRLTAESLTTAMGGRFVSILQSFGLGVKEGTTLLAGFANMGRTGTRATMVLQAGIAALVAPMKDASGKYTSAAIALAKYGLNQETLAQQIHKPGGIIKVLTELNTAFMTNATSAEKAKGISSWLSQIMGSQAGSAFSGLIKQIPELQSLLDGMNKPGATKSAFEIWLSTPSGAVENFKTQMQATLISLGNYLLPGATKVAKWAGDVTDALSKNKNGMGTFAAALAGTIIAALAVGKIAKIGVIIAQAFGYAAGVEAAAIGTRIAVNFAGALGMSWLIQKLVVNPAKSAFQNLLNWFKGGGGTPTPPTNPSTTPKQVTAQGGYVSGIIPISGGAFQEYQVTKSQMTAIDAYFKAHGLKEYGANGVATNEFRTALQYFAQQDAKKNYTVTVHVK